MDSKRYILPCGKCTLALGNVHIKTHKKNVTYVCHEKILKNKYTNEKNNRDCFFFKFMRLVTKQRTKKNWF